MAGQPAPAIRWWTIPVAVGTTQVISGSPLDSTGADVVMIVSLLIVLAALTAFFTDFLQADEHGAVTVPSVVWWSTPVAIIAMSVVFGIGATQAIPSSPAALESQGADIFMVVAILVFLAAISARFTSFLQAEEHGGAGTAAHASAHVGERVPQGVVAHLDG